MIAFASSLDQAGRSRATSPTPRCCCGHMVGQRPAATPPRSGFPSDVALPSAERLDGLRFGVRGLDEEGLEPGVAESCARTLDRIEELGGSVEEIELPHRRPRHLRLLRDRAGRGQRQPRPLRRRPLRPPHRARRRPALDVRGDPRTRASATEVKRRIMIGTYALSSGYYEAYYGTRAEGAHQDRRGLQRRVRAGGLRRHARPRRPSPSSSASAPPTRSRCTCPTTSRCRCRWPASRPSRSRRASPTGCRWASRSPGPAFSESRILDAALCARAGDRLRGGAACRERRELRARDRHRDPRPAPHADEDVLRLRAVLRRGAQHPHLPRLPGPPGPLPVTNAEAVHFGLMIGLALGCEIAPRSIFHRKNYFYPDLPKGTRSASTTSRSAAAGRLGDVRIHRVHLEEDAAKLVHAGASGRIHGAESSVVDFNRGGTPLVEIVTEPDLRSAAEAADFGRAAPGHAAAHGRLRREHGGGLAADGRQRVDPPGRRGRRSAPRPSSRT